MLVQQAALRLSAACNPPLVLRRRLEWRNGPSLAEYPPRLPEHNEDAFLTYLGMRIASCEVKNLHRVTGYSILHRSRTTSQLNAGAGD